MISQMWKPLSIRSNGDPLTIAELNEKNCFLIWPDAEKRPFRYPAAQGRNRSARIPFCHGIAQCHDREKAATFGGRSFGRDLHR